MPKLTEKQSRFVRAYAQHGNATRAADEAGYAHPNAQGPKLVKLGPVKEALDKMRAKAEAKAKLSRDRILELCESIAEGREQEEELSLSGDPVPRMPRIGDRIKAMQLAAKLEGYESARKHEVSGPGGAAIPVEVQLAGYSMEQLFDLAKERG